jgi:hypothetical protein
MMDVSTIKSVALPVGFVLVGEEAGSFGANWLRRFAIVDGTREFSQRQKVEICFGSSGIKHLPEDLESFRIALKNAPQTVFDEETTSNKVLVGDMCLVLGRPGENQVWAEVNGLNAARFVLETMSSTTLHQRPVIQVEGWFRGGMSLSTADEDMSPPDRYYSGVFIDMNPASERAQVEYLFLQCEQEDDMKKFLPQFRTMLESIQWRE